MADKEKVIRGLEICTNPGSCSERCPYYHIEITEGSCDYFLLTDALALLKEQEPRVMTVEEVINAKDKTDVWLDELDCVVVAATISNWVESKNHVVTFFYGIEHTTSGERDYMNNNYNRTWRCWTARPTDEQRKAAKWK